MSILLKSDRLTVEIAEPGEEPNTTIRFDRAGFVTQVTLDGKYQFCTFEPNNLFHPCTGGYGLCNEFGLPSPVLDVPAGGLFPKLGIGLLAKEDDKPYLFYNRYKCNPYEISFKALESSVIFDTAPKPCMGYEVHNTKKLEVMGNELLMTVTVENVGEKPISFDEYCHNFLTIEHLPIGEDYYLSMPIAPQDGKVPKAGESLCGSGQGFTFKGYSNSACFMEVLHDEINREVPFIWKLINKKSPAWVSEEVSAEPIKIAVWSVDHIISPEVICHFEVEPGEKVTWTRKWAFDC